MAYQVLARKWRPRSFRDLVGQGHVVRVLVNALGEGRLHHAFLFTGTRGVGKTTIARVFAKALNCERGVSADPCGECASCREIDEGRFVDLIEVDAASRTKVEDTRELLENVQYTPTRGRYKVYLIDEIHMLSTHSFNALLKTLEEPPPHVKFLLATTDPQRLPVTVLSRCLQLNLNRLPAALIAEHLEALLEKEGIEREASALSLIARSADGSMRDALSLLDQAIAFGGGRVARAEVAEMLGAIDRRHVLRLLDALAAGDAAGVLDAVAELDPLAPDYTSVLADLISALQRIAVAQAVPEVVDESVADPEDIRRLAAALAPEDVQLFYQIALIGRRDLPLSPEPRGGFEMVLLRMLCFRPAAGEAGLPLPARPVAAESAAGVGGAQTLRPARAAVVSAGSDPPVSPASAVRESAAPAADWAAILPRLELSGVARQLALNCVPQGREGDTLDLLLEPACAQLHTRGAEERLQAALAAYYGEPLRVRIELGTAQQAQRQAERQQAAVDSIHQDPNVRALCEFFDARVIPESIASTD